MRGFLYVSVRRQYIKNTPENQGYSFLSEYFPTYNLDALVTGTL